MSQPKEIIKKPGRKAYNKKKLRMPTGDYEHKETPEDYVSHQSRINSGPKGTIDEDVMLEYIEQSGMEEVEPEDIDKIDTGCRFAYVRKQPNKWCSAGWISRVETSHVNADGVKLDKPKKYVIYRGYNNSGWSVQVDDVEMFYVMKPKVKPIIKKMIYFNYPIKKTNYPVTLLDKDGKMVVVYYGKDNHARNTFMSTAKFNKAKEDPEIWDFTD